MKDADIRAFLTGLYDTGRQNDDREQERSQKIGNEHE